MKWRIEIDAIVEAKSLAKAEKLSDRMLDAIADQHVSSIVQPIAEVEDDE